MSTKPRIAFMGTPDFAVTVLHALHGVGHDIVAVYTQPPKAAGRGRQTHKSPVHVAAEKMGLLVRTPKTLRDPEEQKIFADLKLDIAVVVAYGLILPQACLDAPRLGCINIHYSLLPRWRGAAPVQRAILVGDTETGVGIMQMEAGLDTGPILMREKVPITPNSTAMALLNDLSERGAQMTIRAIEGLTAGILKSTSQASEGVTYAAKLSREDGRIDWNKPATDIERQIRALQPWPGCFFMLGDEPIKVLGAEVIHKSDDPGSLLDDQFTVACAKDALRLKLVQRPGKNATDGASFLRGLKLSKDGLSGIRLA